MISNRLTETDSARIWNLTGLIVTRIVVDPAQVTLHLDTGSNADTDELDLVIENSFMIRTTNGTTQLVNPLDGESLIPILSLRLRPAISLVAGRDGSLTLRFAEGVELRVAKHDRYEGMAHLWSR